MTMARPGSGLRASLEASTGIEVRDHAAGVVHLPIGDYVRNSLGAVQGGMMATVATTAAAHALTAAAGVPQRVVDLQITYLSLARVGPVVTRTTVLDATPDFGTARVELVDAGADDRVATVVRARRTVACSAFDDPDAGRAVARYLGLTLEEVGEAREGAATVVGRAPAATHLRAPDGTIAMGALLGLADSVAGLCGGLAALPGWVVSTNLVLRAVDLDVVGPLALRADVLRAGRNAVVTAVQARDAGAHDRLVADGALTSAVLVPEDGPPVYERPLVLTAPTVDPATTPALPKFLGTRATDADTLSIELTEPLRNPWGILHGGVTAALVDLAARHATGRARDHRHRAALPRTRPGRTGDRTGRAGGHAGRRHARARRGRATAAPATG